MLHNSESHRAGHSLTAPQATSLGRPLSDFRIIWEVIESYHPRLSSDGGELVEKRVGFHLDQLRASFPNIHDVQGKRILDLACGSRNYEDDTLNRYEPWMCRLLLHLGALPVGVDLAPQRDERFKAECADLTIPDALSFLETQSFDAAYISAFPTRKAIRHLVSKGLSWPAMRENILVHTRRCLKPDGIIIRQFTEGDEELVRGVFKENRAPSPEPHLPPNLRNPLPRHYYDDDEFLL